MLLILEWMKSKNYFFCTFKPSEFELNQGIMINPFAILVAFYIQFLYLLPITLVYFLESLSRISSWILCSYSWNLLSNPELSIWLSEAEYWNLLSRMLFIKVFNPFLHYQCTHRLKMLFFEFIIIKLIWIFQKTSDLIIIFF